MKKTVKTLLLVENRQLNKDNFLLRLKSDENLSDICPGQFVNVEISKSKEIFLRRPFSVLDVDYTNGIISLLVKVLGRGSKVFTEYEAGDTVSVVFPLGRGFSAPAATDKILLIGGGSGVAPMLFMAKTCGLKPEQIHLILGARSAVDLIDVDDYKNLATFYYTTEDGSFGEKGFVTQHSLFVNHLAGFSRIYTCGPNPMMKAIAREAYKHNIFCEVSLENTMACGFGVCLCCVEDTKHGNQCVCTEGPVFNINDLKWQI